MRHILYSYMRLIAAATAAAAGLFLTSCEDEPDRFRQADGIPTVYYVRPVDVNAADSLMTGAYMDNQICIVGENLRSIYELWFNDQQAILNTSYMTDNTLIVTVPGTIPALVTDKMYMITAARDTVSYDFSVLVPGPSVSSMSCEYADAGSEATIYGDYLIDDPNVPISIVFSGDVPVTEFTSIERTAVSFIVPEGAVEGPVTVTTIYGTKESTFHYLDSRGFMFDFDEGGTGLSNHGWHDRLIQDVDGIKGNYVQLGDGQTAMSEDGGWNDSQFSFEYWCGSWDTPQNMTSGNGMALNNLVDFTDFANMSLKFEMCVPSDFPWSAGAMQIAFEGYDRVTYSGYAIEGYTGTVASANMYVFNDDDGISGSFGRAIYRPWTSAANGSFHTSDEWVTVTIPLSNFIYDRLGAVTNTVLSSPADFASLSIFVVGGGINGKECTPVIRLDNIRAVPNR